MRRGDARRPDRRGFEGGQLVGCHAHDLAHEEADERLAIAAGEERPQARRELLGGRRAGVRARAALVDDEAPDVRRPERRPECAPAPVRVPEEVDRPARPAALRGRRVDDRRHVLELADDRVGERVAACAAAAPIERVAGEPLAEERLDDPERGVVGGRAVDEHERRPAAAPEPGDRGPVAGDRYAA